MNDTIKSKSYSQLVKYGTPFLIALVVAVFLLFRYGPWKERKPEEIEKEAAERIEALKGELSEPVDLERADRFVDAKTILSKKDQRIITTTPKTLLEDRILKEGGVVMETTPRKLMEDESITPDTPIKIIEKVEKVAVTTPEELQKKAPSPDTRIKVIVEKPGETLTLAQLLRGEKELEGDTFYIHAVNRGDVREILFTSTR
jgi:hypothetical protein